MKRLAAVLLLAGLTQGPPARAADWQRTWKPFPTTQSPTPVADPKGTVARASGLSRVPDRTVSPAGDYRSMPTGVPLPTGFSIAPAGGCAAAGCEGGKSRSCLDRLKAWLCFQPTTRDALPKLHPHPYVGPVAGTFICTSVGCGAGGGAADGNGCGAGLLGRLGLTDRGCRNGKCVPPADDAIPGYRFAAVNPPALPDPPAAVSPHTVYKPGAPDAAGVKPAGGTARPFARP